MILAHFTATDASSTALVVGIALFVTGLRGVRTGPATARTRSRRLLGTGVVTTVAGVALVLAHDA